VDPAPPPIFYNWTAEFIPRGSSRPNLSCIQGPIEPKDSNHNGSEADMDELTPSKPESKYTEHTKIEERAKPNFIDRFD
jgi:hypothetical protein